MRIKTINNGWVVEEVTGEEKAFLNLQDLFDYLLLCLAGKAEHFGGSLYGKVRIDLKERAE